MSDLITESSAKQARNIFDPYGRTEYQANDMAVSVPQDGALATGAVQNTSDLPASIVTIGTHAASSPENQFYEYYRRPGFSSFPATTQTDQRDTGDAARPSQSRPPRASADADRTSPVTGLAHAADPQETGPPLSSPTSSSGAHRAMIGMELFAEDDGDGDSDAMGGGGGGGGPEGGIDGSGNGENLGVTGSSPSYGDGSSGLPISGGTTPNTPPASGTHITVYGHAVTIINGISYLTSDSGSGIATYQTASGAHVPIKLSDINQDIQTDVQNIFGRSATESDYSSAYQQFGSGQSPDQVRSDIAHSSEAQNDINSVYQQVLGRNVDSSGLNTYENALSSTMTLDQVRSDIAHSSEAQNDINSVYQQVLGRNVDSSGLNTYENALSSTMTLDQVRSDIAHSSEAQNDINSVYQQVLGRNVDSSGLNTYENALSSTRTLDQVRSDIAHSSEAQNDINSVYQQVLGRGADSSGLNTYENALSSTMTLDQVRSDIAHSSEAQNDINSVYQQVLGRNVDSSGLNTYENALSSTRTLDQVRSDIANSQEAYNAIFQRMQSLLGRGLNADEINTIHNIQSGLASGQTTMTRVMNLLDLGASLINISNNLDPNSYTPVPSPSPTAYSYTDGSGRTFYLDSKVSLHDVVAAGLDLKTQLDSDLDSLSDPENIAGQFYQSFKENVGQGGRFDIQRDNENHVLYQPMIPGANYIVGIFSAAAGLSNTEIEIVAGIYAAIKSNEPVNTYYRDSPLWLEGANDYNSGIVK